MVEPTAIVERLARAINAHDLEAIVACFDADFESRQPAHPARDFRGADQVRRNWAQILGAVPDLAAALLRNIASGQSVWSEWSWTGARADGVAFAMRGVTISEVGADRVVAVHFYMEPVETAGSDIASAVTQAVGPR